MLIIVVVVVVNVIIILSIVIIVLVPVVIIIMIVKYQFLFVLTIDQMLLATGCRAACARASRFVAVPEPPDACHLPVGRWAEVSHLDHRPGCNLFCDSLTPQIRPWAFVSRCSC